MRNGYIHIIICALLLCFSASSCRAKKDLERKEEVMESYQRIEHSADSLRIEEIRTDCVVQISDELVRSYTRVTEFDSSGTIIRRLQESWWDRRRGDVSLQDDRSETVSIAGSQKLVEEKDTTMAEIHEISHASTDSRPVQGVEWIWVILSLVLILGVVIYIIHNKKR